MTETEIKFRCGDLDALRGRVVDAGGEKVSEFFEDNVVYDDRGGTLRASGRLLRLRKSDRVSLTFKKPIEKKVFKVMEELEVEVSDFDSMDAILLSLGYVKTFRYQKRRAIYALGRCSVNLDETPIGNFVEIEGEKADIEGLAAILGLPMREGISKNYRELYREHCGKEGAEPDDMVFRGEENA
jgi:adenylate cyclase, class 2